MGVVVTGKLLVKQVLLHVLIINGSVGVQGKPLPNILATQPDFRLEREGSLNINIALLSIYII